MVYEVKTENGKRMPGMKRKREREKVRTIEGEERGERREKNITSRINEKKHAIEYLTKNVTQHYTTLHYTTMHYTVLHNTTLHFTTPNEILDLLGIFLVKVADRGRR